MRNSDRRGYTRSERYNDKRWGRYNPGQIEKFFRMDGNLAFAAIYDGKIIGLIYGYTLCQMNK